MAKSPAKVPDKADDKEQSERFVEAVRKHEADETGKSLGESFRKIAKQKPTTRGR